MDFSESPPTDMLVEHITRIEEWLAGSILEAKEIVTLEDAHDNLRAWYRKCFMYLTSTLKGLSFTEYISLRFDRKLAKNAIVHSVNSTAGHELRKHFHLSLEEHRLLEEAEIKVLNRFNQEYSTLKDCIPCRIKRTPGIEYYLRDISVDELRQQFPHNLDVRGAGARVIRVIKQELMQGHIIKIDNMSEFHRCLVVTYGDIIPRNVQQMSRELRKVTVSHAK